MNKIKIIIALALAALAGCDIGIDSDKYGYVNAEYASHLTVEEIVKLNSEIYNYSLDRSRNLDGPEYKLSEDARNRLAHEITQRFQSKRIPTVDALKFINVELCNGNIEDIDCFYKYSIWNAFLRTDAESFIKSVIQFYDEEKVTANKDVFGVFLGNAYERGEGVSVNYEKAVQYYESAWKLGYKPAAKGLYQTYSHFGSNNKCNAYLWAIRSGAYLADLEKELSASDIADTQKVAPDIAVLKM